MTTEPHIDPESLVARIIAELQANPDAQRLLLRALLTNEFLGMPARLDRIEKDIAELKADVAELKTDMVEVKADVSQLKTDVSQLKTDVSQLKADVGQLKTDVGQLKTDVGQLKTDVAFLKGSELENRLHRSLRPVLMQQLGLRRPRIVQSQLQDTVQEFADPVDTALQDGIISRAQDDRIARTDLIFSAQRVDSRAFVLVVVEASSTVNGNDIRRARESANILAAVFPMEAIATVAGYSIDRRDLARAEESGVRFVQVPS